MIETIIKPGQTTDIKGYPDLDQPFEQLMQSCRATETNGCRWVYEPSVKVETHHLRFNDKSFWDFDLKPSMIIGMYLCSDRRYVIFVPEGAKFTRPQDVYRAGFYTLRDKRTKSRPHVYGDQETWAGCFKQTQGLTLARKIPGSVGGIYTLERHPSNPQIMYIDLNAGVFYEDVLVQKRTRRTRIRKAMMQDYDEFDGK